MYIPVFDNACQLEPKKSDYWPLFTWFHLLKKKRKSWCGNAVSSSGNLPPGISLCTRSISKFMSQKDAGITGPSRAGRSTVHPRHRCPSPPGGRPRILALASRLAQNKLSGFTSPEHVAEISIHVRVSRHLAFPLETVGVCAQGRHFRASPGCSGALQHPHASHHRTAEN